MLIDEIQNHDEKKGVQAINLNPDPNAPIPGLLNLLPQVAVYNLKGVAAAYDRITQTGFNYTSHVTNIRPPYDVTWFEFDIPSKTQSIHVAALAEVFEMPRQEVLKKTLYEVRKQFSDEDLQRMRAGETTESLRGDEEEKAVFHDVVTVCVTLIVKGNYGQFYFYPRLVQVVGKRTGEPLTVPIAPRYDLSTSQLKLAPDLIADIEESRKIMGERANLVWFACTLLTCKNISTEIIAPDKKLQKARQRRGKAPLRDYYVLNVNLPGQRQFAAGTNKSNEHVRFHTVAGHLADYREGAGLFGKYKGVFWIPAHVRGDRDKGNVTKSYALQTEKQ